MITLIVYMAVLLLLGVLITDNLYWRKEADELNEDNLKLVGQVDVLERALEAKPRIQFGPQIGKPAADSEWPELMFQEKPVQKLPGALRNVVPFQRGRS